MADDDLRNSWKEIEAQLWVECGQWLDVMEIG